MTRKEAKSCISTIEMLQRLAYNIHGVMDVIDADNCEKIIKALEQEPSGDLISRQAVYDLMRSLTRWCVRSEDGKFDNVGLLYDDVMFGIDKLPSVNPQEPILDKIELKCDRINSLASVLPYTAHREIQELLCEIMDLCKAESDDE